MATKTKEAQAAEYEARAKADFNPEETAAERYARLKAETASALAEARKAARAEETTEFGSTYVNAKFAQLISDIEKATGKTLRALSVRYMRPGDEPGVIVTRHRLVKARSQGE